ncbi:MAG: hypothetical protein A3G10_03185 [Candidatus Wildermuthbacteria bacterium RIFCSPLOWO2_12_FULL_49_9]|nr:MAG: hypothetical protein A3D63_00965 [Candidatus Wildermuthbacteria bacterium RIFCSPHIGHO2_02_FULL_49_17]OHA77866.1 MAG: hypothetical protein A3G10_03185 [Candidatus Wildermuthbacteria bacterium RIFCSPLOWO2_12_FULL_49_9]
MLALKYLKSYHEIMNPIFTHLQNRSLAHVMRFSSWPQHFPESVAEHSFFTAYFTSILSYLLQKAGESIDAGKAVQMALVHDMEETFSGDILGPFKHYSPELSRAIRKVNEETILEVFEGLPADLRDYYILLWKEEGSGESLEAEIVKVADKLSLLAKCLEEMNAGNGCMGKVYEESRKKLEEYEAPWWQKIKSQILA